VVRTFASKTMNFSTPLGALRIIGILEGCSFLLFGLTMPLKYMMAMPTPNKIIGMAHGILFIAYVLLVFVVSQDKKWPAKTKFWAYAASLLPFGTFVADSKIFKKYQREYNS
jgi:integral membrane protein